MLRKVLRNGVALPAAHLVQTLKFTLIFYLLKQGYYESENFRLFRAALLLLGQDFYNESVIFLSGYRSILCYLKVDITYFSNHFKLKLKRIRRT